MKSTLATLALAIGLSTQAADEAFMSALSKLESNNKPNAVGDKHLANHAYGLYQMRLPAITDVNRAFHTDYVPEDMINPSVAREAAQMYLYLLGKNWKKKHPNKVLTPYILARMWNGGYNGADKDITKGYGTKFIKIYAQKMNEVKNVCQMEKNNQGGI